MGRKYNVSDTRMTVYEYGLGVCGDFGLGIKADGSETSSKKWCVSVCIVR